MGERRTTVIEHEFRKYDHAIMSQKIIKNCDGRALKPKLVAG